MDIKVSVIIPIYNSEQYLENCIKSVIEQEYENIEIILINDGSEDNSGIICDMFAERDNRIKVLHNTNQGVSISRNIGINIASGEYLFFMDSDDYIEANTISVLIERVKKSKSDLLIFGYNNIDKIKKNTIVHDLDKIINIDELLEIMLDKKYYMYFNYLWNKLYKTECIKNNKILFDSQVNLGEDALFNIEVYKNIKNIEFVKLPLYNYVLKDSNSLTSKKNKIEYTLNVYKNIFIQYKNLYNHYGCINKYEPYILERYLVSLIGVFTDLEIKCKEITLKDKIQFIKNVCLNNFTKENIKGVKPSNFYLSILKFFIVNKKYMLIYCTIFIKEEIKNVKNKICK